MPLDSPRPILGSEQYVHINPRSRFEESIGRMTLICEKRISEYARQRRHAQVPNSNGLFAQTHKRVTTALTPNDPLRVRGAAQLTEK